MRQEGFTLVELAVVMIIIGLLLGGVLKGAEIVYNAKYKRTLSDFKSMMAAHYTFVDMYRAIPGDMANATIRVPGCNGANNCANGDGNGMVGTRINNSTHIESTPTIQENIQYWKHLSLADLIKGVNPGASNNPGNSLYGESHPEAPVGGGWNVIMTVPAGVGDYGGNGILYHLTGTPNRNDLALTPLMAERFDRDLDDGRPNTGSVTAEYAASSSCDDDASNSYRTDLTSIECIVYFEVDL
jgi:prepilin-type N-terminal cleavage/methylation domain-containing protein